MRSPIEYHRLETGCVGVSGGLHQLQASSAQNPSVRGAPAGAQLGGLDLMAILVEAGVRPMQQSRPELSHDHANYLD